MNRSAYPSTTADAPGTACPPPATGADAYRVLQQRSTRGGLWTVTAEGLTFAIRLLSLAALGRLLLPREFGLMGMVVALTGFAHLFKDLGLADATIQRERLTDAQASTLFWINAATGAALSALAVVCAPLIAGFYGEPSLRDITVALSASFLFSGVSVQHQALLRRQMKFGRLAVARIGGVLAGVVVAVALAWHGWGIWSLVGMHVCEPACTAAGLWLASGWRPRRMRRAAGVREMLHFGADVTGFNAINYFARNLDNILIGRQIGPAQLGLYARAYRLLLMPILLLRTPLASVCMSGLSTLQNSPAQFREYFRAYLSLLAFLSFPVVVCLGICADTFIALILGPRWSGAVPIFRILACVALIQPVASSWGVVLVTLGQTRRYLMCGVVNSVLVMLGFLVGIRWGTTGVAFSYVVVNYAMLLPNFWWCTRSAPVSAGDLLRSVARPAAAALVMACVLWWLRPLPDACGLFAALVLYVLAGGTAYLATWAFLPGGKEHLEGLVRHLRAACGGSS